jgi:hypothetical protein
VKNPQKSEKERLTGKSSGLTGEFEIIFASRRNSVFF